jgi:hypothetical protein
LRPWRVLAVSSYGASDARGGLQALVSLLAFSEADGTRLNRDRIVLVASTAVTLGLVALYIYGKVAGRW